MSKENLTLFDTVDVANVFVCGIEYGDYSGLNDDDISQLKIWLSGLPDSCVFEYSEGSNFCICDITGLASDCASVDIWSL